MAHTFTFTVSVVLERESGKFMSRDEMAEQITDALESADPGQVDGGPDGDSTYYVSDWSITEES